MKPLLSVAAIVLTFLSLSAAHAQEGYCLATGGGRGQNTCGHTITVIVQFSNGTHGAIHLASGQSESLRDSMGNYVSVLMVCRYPNGVRYMSGRPVGCQ